VQPQFLICVKGAQAGGNEAVSTEEEVELMQKGEEAETQLRRGVARSKALVAHYRLKISGAAGKPLFRFGNQPKKVEE
jgi:hypothetical protein